MVNIKSLLSAKEALFLSHLHDGELSLNRFQNSHYFLSHLHDGEQPCSIEMIMGRFLSHLHDGEPPSLFCRP